MKDLFSVSSQQKRFFNGWDANHRTPPRWQMLKWLYKRRPLWPKVSLPATSPLSTLPEGELAVLVNHATVFLRLADTTILTDPVFCKRLGPVAFLGIARAQEAGLQLESLPKIDIVVISHNHYDHLDWPTLRRLKKKSPFKIICPIGLEKAFLRRGFKDVIPLEWWQSLQISAHVKLTSVPAQHWSQRTLNDRNRSLWMGVMIEAGQQKLYFPGDTGYGQHFSEIRKRLGAPSVSFLPIGSYLPEWLMEHHHMSPREAVKAHQDLESQVSLPIHFDTFPLGDEPYGQALKDLENERQILKEPEAFKLWNNGGVWPLA